MENKPENNNINNINNINIKNTANYFEPELNYNDLCAISSVGLAHMGDAVYEILVRTWLCTHGGATGRGLHKATIQMVRAEAQAESAEYILPYLTEQEQDIFRRGRNAQVYHTIPAHASRAQYAKATALEALFGWLYLNGQRERVNELFCVIMNKYT